MVFPVFFAFVLITLELQKVDDLYKKFEVIEAIDDAGIIVLELRRYEKNVLIFNREKEHLKLFHDNIKSLRKKLREIDKDLADTLGNETRDELTTVVNKYEESFHSSMGNMDERALLVEDIRPVGREIESSLKNKELVLQLRRSEKNFIIYKEESAAKEVDLISEKLLKEQLQPGVADTIKQYQSTFNEIVDNFKRQDEILHDMRMNARKIEKIISDLSYRQRNHVNLSLKKGKTPFFVAFIVLLVSTVFVGYLFSYGFLKTLDKMQRALSTLEGGKFVPLVAQEVPPEFESFIETYNQVTGRINYNIDRAENLLERGVSQVNKSETILETLQMLPAAAAKNKKIAFIPRCSQKYNKAAGRKRRRRTFSTLRSF